MNQGVVKARPKGPLLGRTIDNHLSGVYFPPFTCFTALQPEVRFLNEVRAYERGMGNVSMMYARGYAGT